MFEFLWRPCQLNLLAGFCCHSKNKYGRDVQMSNYGDASPQIAVFTLDGMLSEYDEEKNQKSIYLFLAADSSWIYLTLFRICIILIINL